MLISAQFYRRSHIKGAALKARTHYSCMSWLSEKPPWTAIQWYSWGDPHTVLWKEGPFIQTRETTESNHIADSTLYKLKQTIETLDQAGSWEFLKRSSNPYELVCSQSQDPRIPQSVCTLKPLSRSYFKMTELLTVLDFFKRHPSSLRPTIVSAHVCEGPGGFIESLIFLSAKQPIRVERAHAMTLKPSRSNIPGWKRAYNFLKKSPMVQIEYGADDTGDILVKENQEAFLEKTRGKCSIFTADGGFDFSEHYGTQEAEVFSLLVSSSLIGLQTMNKGGDFILKMFDTELKCTKDLIAILAYCFDSWTLYKPALSRPCNAEKYFLGRGCRVVPPWILRALGELRDLTKSGKHVSSIFTVLPEHIERDIDILKKEYLDQQIAALDYAISKRVEWNENPDAIWAAISEHSTLWCKQFQMPLRPFSGFMTPLQPVLDKRAFEMPSGIKQQATDSS